MKVRLKKGFFEAPYYGKIVYPSDNYIVIEDKYRSLVEADEHIEILQEEKVKVDSVKSVETVKPAKPVVDKIEVDENKPIVDEDLIQEILYMQWAKAKKKIMGITDVDFLRNKLLPELESSNKTVLITATKERIGELDT